jgi:hypothetical protein
MHINPAKAKVFGREKKRSDCGDMAKYRIFSGECKGLIEPSIEK